VSLVLLEVLYLLELLEVQQLLELLENLGVLRHRHHQFLLQHLVSLGNPVVL
jgi:hypothetical protein